MTRLIAALERFVAADPESVKPHFIFGALTKDSLKNLLDLSPRERAVIYPLVVLVIFFGVYPAPILDATAASVDALVNSLTLSLDVANAAVEAGH